MITDLLKGNTVNLQDKEDKVDESDVEVIITDADDVEDKTALSEGAASTRRSAVQRSVVLVVTSPSSPVPRPRLGVSTALVVESPVIFSDFRSEDSFFRECGPDSLGRVVNVFKVRVL